MSQVGEHISTSSMITFGQHLPILYIYRFCTECILLTLRASSGRVCTRRKRRSCCCLRLATWRPLAPEENVCREGDPPISPPRRIPEAICCARSSWAGRGRLAARLPVCTSARAVGQGTWHWTWWWLCYWECWQDRDRGKGYKTWSNRCTLTTLEGNKRTAPKAIPASRKCPKIHAHISSAGTSSYFRFILSSSGAARWEGEVLQASILTAIPFITAQLQSRLEPIT